MARRRYNKQKGRGRFINQNIPAAVPKTERLEKAREVKLQISLMGLNTEGNQDIKRLYVILDLWVNYNRSHQEILDLPSVKDKMLEIKLYSVKNKESKIVLKHISN